MTCSLPSTNLSLLSTNSYSLYPCSPICSNPHNLKEKICSYSDYFQPTFYCKDFHSAHCLCFLKTILLIVHTSVSVSIVLYYYYQYYRLSSHSCQDYALRSSWAQWWICSMPSSFGKGIFCSIMSFISHSKS